jgi:(p)ppGpp synthase/HD superfamily hydrolase
MTSTLAAKAKAAAVMAHESIGQCRKYGAGHYGPERYYFHCCRVAELVATATDDQEIVAAAALHDVLEDVSPTSEVYHSWWLISNFGPRVAHLVYECSNVYSKDTAQQQCLEDMAQRLVQYRVLTEDDLNQLQTQQVQALLMNRNARKTNEGARYATISDDAKIIKRADLFDNSLSMGGAPESFVEKWMAEKAAIDKLIGTWQERHARPEPVALA